MELFYKLFLIVNDICCLRTSVQYSLCQSLGAYSHDPQAQYIKQTADTLSCRHNNICDSEQTSRPARNPENAVEEVNAFPLFSLLFISLLYLCRQ